VEGAAEVIAFARNRARRPPTGPAPRPRAERGDREGDRGGEVPITDIDPLRIALGWTAGPPALVAAFIDTVIEPAG